MSATAQEPFTGPVRPVTETASKQEPSSSAAKEAAAPQAQSFAPAATEDLWSPDKVVLWFFLIVLAFFGLFLIAEPLLHIFH